MGKGSKPTIGFWYHVAYHHGLTIGPIDAFLEFRGGDKTAWRGELTASGTLHVNAPYLWGGEKDQGGIVGDLDVMFGEPAQAANPYLVSVFGNQTAAWRGFSTVAFKGGRYGAMNPYPQKPSYKIRQIKQGWDDGCWYPETAEIPIGDPIVSSAELGPTSTGWRYKIIASADTTDYSSVVYDDSAWLVGQSPFANRPDHPYLGGNFPAAMNTYWPELTRLWLRRTFNLFKATDCSLELFVDDYATVWVNGTKVLDRVGPSGGTVTTASFLHQITIPAALVHAGINRIAVLAEDTVPTNPYSYAAFRVLPAANSPLGINPAHVLYYSRTNAEMGRESPSSINDGSLRAAADKLYAEGFGICPKWDPATESVEDFEKRICKLIGGSFTRSLEDGQWYLDLARGDYVLADLPILTDDDILGFKEQPSILDTAVNSVSVRYKDPERKETIVTAPTRALGLVAAFGTIHQTTDYPEIPNADLSTRVALRDVLATATPTRAFDLVTTRRTYAWRPNQYFRLQSAKRGIADMVCIVGEKGSGTLKSGAISLKAAQDIYSLPATSYVQVEPGVDTRPPQTPTPITQQHAVEAPYVEIAAMLSRADLAALPAEVGYVMAVAANPGSNLDYTMMVADLSGDYVDAGRGEWCASATVVEAAGYPDTDFTLTGGTGLGGVEIGMGALWGDEIVRVDAIDVGAGTITLGRGCADSVPQAHASGSRLWFYPTGFAYDATEFAGGEVIDVKLLANTGSAQQLLDAVTALPVTFAGRAARPYPPGQLRINGATDPESVIGAITVSGVHRDRVQQADQLVDSEMAAIGPEAGTTYTVRYMANGTLVATDGGLTTLASTYTPTVAGAMRVEVESTRDGLTSYQMHVREFSVGQVLLDETGALITTEDDQLIIMG